MARSKFLTDKEKDTIVKMHNAGISAAATGRAIGRTKQCVLQYIKRTKEGGGGKETNLLEYILKDRLND